MTNLPFDTSIKLKRGSHKLPSEGSCAMEVAILAAGYGWHEVESDESLPPCMSRVIGAYVIRLNDAMPDDERQKLMRFVTRMSGTAATPEIEQQRAEYLVMHAAKPAAVSALKSAGLNKHAAVVSAAQTIVDLREVARAEGALLAASLAGTVSWDEETTVVAAKAAEAASWSAWAAGAAVAADAAAGAAEAARVAAGAAQDAFDWRPYLAALEGALAIGPQADPIDVADIEERTRVLVKA